MATDYLQTHPTSPDDLPGIAPFISSAPGRLCRGYQTPTILVTMGGMGNALAARLAQVTAQDERGATVPLGRFWDTKPVVLGFVRHFG